MAKRRRKAHRLGGRRVDKGDESAGEEYDRLAKQAETSRHGGFAARGRLEAAGNPTPRGQDALGRVPHRKRSDHAGG
jgi:hypothetical protein